MLWIGLVWLACSLCAVFETTVGAPTQCSESGIQQNPEAGHCENQIHPGAGLSCCGGKVYNPAVATCCKGGENKMANVTCGLSEMVSACCGPRAYSPVNEICCDSTVVTKPVAFAQCCGREAYDEHSQLCCGPLNNRTVLEKSEHHQCCGRDRFDTTSQCCCSTDVSLKIHEKKHPCCKPKPDNCGNNTYNMSVALCCQSTVVKKNSSNSQCCGKKAYDKDKQLCCGPLDNRTVLNRKSSHQCCGLEQFNTTSQCCCFKNGSLEILPKHPITNMCCVEETAVCGTKTYYKPDELCCQSTVVRKNSPNSQCCGKEAYDEHNQLCCGPLVNRTVLDRKSRHHQCCGLKQFDTKTSCCCVINRSLDIHLDIHPRDHKCCVEESGLLPPTPGPQPTCTAQEIICGLSCCNLSDCRCCEGKRSNKCCTTGQSDAAVNNPETDVCCDSHVRNPRQDQHNGSQGHCCGTELYYPHNETCCDGHRKIETTHMKCCAGTLYNKTLYTCCGSILQKKQKDFKCCGPLYYNTSLWACCAGKLIPVKQPGCKQAKTNEGKGVRKNSAKN